MKTIQFLYKTVLWMILFPIVGIIATLLVLMNLSDSLVDKFFARRGP